jgi:hypothetical protein
MDYITPRCRYAFPHAHAHGGDVFVVVIVAAVVAAAAAAVVV